MDFFNIVMREIENGPNKGTFEVFPDFQIGRSKDLMVRGKSFYAIWDEEAGLWSRDEYDVQRLVDAELRAYTKRLESQTGLVYKTKYLVSHSNKMWREFRNFVQLVSDNAHDLDDTLTFANTDVKKTDYVSKRLPYALVEGDCSAWDELIGTLYSVEERAKLEWAIGAIVSGDAKTIQKFLVLYGAPGTGKGTYINIVQKLFGDYLTTFDAKALGSSAQAFATEVFKDNPLVAIQHDGDLSRIEDNARLNSIISHESMPMNEKYKASYTSWVKAMLILGTNKPVKISDAKSGIIRRLIDVHPTGVKIPENHYNTLMSRVDHELGAIAYHCRDVYLSMGKNAYNTYRPLEMMLQTDIFFNFIEANFDVFKQQNSTSVRQAYAMYKEWCDDTRIDKPLPQYKFREELRNYFDEYKERGEIDGVQVRSMYVGFNANKFKEPKKDTPAFSLVIEETDSLFDKEYADLPAQYANEHEWPEKKWINVNTVLADIDPTRLHYVKIPHDMIMIDFDIKDPITGEKSLEANLEAASVWPPTYAELSKGGSGVHLLYWAPDGVDVEELAVHYSEGIEVKTLLGDASMRRRLTKCNHVPIAKYTGMKLPVKEKKVLSQQKIQSEKGLRELIQRCLRKEFHGSTKPSVDFIAKILDDAYSDGLDYNLTDMRSTIVAFANNSTNQPTEALRVVMRMKFKGQDVPEAPLDEDPDLQRPGLRGDVARAGGNPDIFVKEDTPADSRPVFFDVEVYPNLFVICWKYAGADTVQAMINPTAQEVADLLKFKLIGYNIRRYDNHIMYGAFMGYNNEQLYALSQRIINNEKNALFGEAYNLSYTDIYDYMSEKMSLKKLQILLGIPHKEMDLPWDQPVKDEDIPAVVEYCKNDVVSTEIVHEKRKADFNARQMLAALSGLTANDTTAKHTARIIFGNDRTPQTQFVYTDLSKEFPGYEFHPMRSPKSQYKGEDPSEGGYVYSEPGYHENVVVLDVASMHPTSMVQLNLFGDFYTPRFKGLLDARLAIKNGDYETARTMLNGKLAPYLTDEGDAELLSYALKIVINTVYGLTSASFENPFRDPRNKDNIVAKRGALFMIDMKEFAKRKIADGEWPSDCQVVHIKTDSIKVSCPTQPEKIPMIVEDVTNFGQKYGYDFEHEATYDKFLLIDKAQYIAHYGWAAKEKKIGTWHAVGAEFQHPYIYKTLFSREEITFEDLCEVKQVTKGALHLDFEKQDKPESPAGMQFVGKIGKFVPVEDGGFAARLYRVVDGKPFAATGTTGYLWLEAEMAQEMGESASIDMSYFESLVDKAVKKIENYVPIAEFVG